MHISPRIRPRGARSRGPIWASGRKAGRRIGAGTCISSERHGVEGHSPGACSSESSLQNHNAAGTSKLLARHNTCMKTFRSTEMQGCSVYPVTVQRRSADTSALLAAVRKGAVCGLWDRLFAMNLPTCPFVLSASANEVLKRSGRLAVLLENCAIKPLFRQAGACGLLWYVRD